MADLRELEQAIQDRVAAAEYCRRHHEDQQRRRHEARTLRAQHFRAVADRLLRQHVQPRLERLVAPFPATPLHAAEQGSNRCVYLFRPGERFPAGGTLEVAVHHDLDVEQVFLLYRLDLRPVPFDYVSHDRLVLPLEAADDERAAAWIEQKLLGALDVCLRLQAGDHPAAVQPEPEIWQLASYRYVTPAEPAPGPRAGWR